MSCSRSWTDSFAQYSNASDRGNALLAAGKASDALDILAADSTIAKFNAGIRRLTGGLDLNAKGGMQVAGEATTASRRATWIDLAISLLIMGLCALIGLILTRIIAPRIANANVAPAAVVRQGT